jgi:hypothetical protein
MARELLAAHDAGRVEVAIGRASDYFGPRGGAQSNLGDRLFPAALAGSTASVLGDPDIPRQARRLRLPRRYTDTSHREHAMSDPRTPWPVRVDAARDLSLSRAL